MLDGDGAGASEDAGASEKDGNGESDGDVDASGAGLLVATGDIDE
jgi:hypothetical protein